MGRDLGARFGRPLAGAAALGLSFGLGLVLGRSDAAPPIARSASGLSPASRRPIAAAHGAHAADEGHPARTSRAAPLEQSPAGEVGPAPAPVDLEASLSAARAAAAAPADEELCHLAQDAADELEAAVLGDPGARAAALARLRAARDPAELEFLAAVLGRVRDLAVEEAALELIRATSPAVQAAGYDLLDALDLPSARAASLDGLARSRDPAVRRAALNALPQPVGASQEDARQVIASLTGLLAGDRDPELRRRAAIELGRWHRGPEDLSPVLAALLTDPDPAVRAGAAFGLEVSTRRDPQVVDALLGALRRPDEDPLVRENAWKALGAMGPLPPAVQAEWQRYETQVGARGDG